MLDSREAVDCLAVMAPSLANMRARRAALTVALMAPWLAGCDPIFSISGAFFPAWLLCMVGGLIAAVLIREVIARVGIEPHIGPRLLMYSALYLACTCTLWLLFFAR